MSRKIIALATLLLIMNLIISCITISPGSRREIIGEVSQVKIEAVKFPEVHINTSYRSFPRAKLMSLEGENLTLLPYPYWKVEPVEINLNEIYSIRLIKKGNEAAKRFLGGFSIGFLVVAGLGFVSGGLKYDEDYSLLLTSSIYSGVSAGLFRLALGGKGSKSLKSRYNFYKMSKIEKVRVIIRIMGL